MSRAVGVYLESWWAKKDGGEFRAPVQLTECGKFLCRFDSFVVMFAVARIAVGNHKPCYVTSRIGQLVDRLDSWVTGRLYQILPASASFVLINLSLIHCNLSRSFVCGIWLIIVIKSLKTVLTFKLDSSMWVHILWMHARVAQWFFCMFCISVNIKYLM